LDKLIYLDNAATIKPSEAVVQCVAESCDKYYYNPMAGYNGAVGVDKQIEAVKAEFASVLGVEKSTLHFTSGATESNNWALIKGHKQKNGIVVTSLAEHPSVYNVVKHMQSSGVEVFFVPLKFDGTVDIQKLKECICGKTVSIVSIVHTCGQTGAINDIKQVVKVVKQNSQTTLVHSDGVQAFGKFNYNLLDLGVDLYTVSVHKLGGLKGLGILYIKKGLSIAPILFGGADNQLRVGTPNTTAILSSGIALKEYIAKPRDEYVEMRRILIEELDTLQGVKINGNGVAHIVSLSIEGIKAEVLQSCLDSVGVVVGVGSACNTKRSQNRVLSAMGLDNSLVESSIRISFGPHNTVKEIQTASKKIVEQVNRLRQG